MNIEEFEELLKLAGLSRKEFARINELHQNTITNWNTRGIPGWVEPWLENHIKAKAFDEMMELGDRFRKKVK